ncbi:glycoside hydrolase family 97 catalytic domain-containing protein [Chitinophaga oryzae]|uniref:Glycoside hydrolase family 97 catalytic domain-containing protein n=1 Tax=Chitinophaga oryzae TaxID=2725414 RepID=A0AAE6ZCR5_9BACT|nr:glycoside hydrolase family 97 protein [Chitinophaga oryzae]QJB30576.1 glycoside hydrolase family 97 catalytic domain-containing protein [Chitinophaga oryzae]
MNWIKIVPVIFTFSVTQAFSQSKAVQISSPDQQIQVSVWSGAEGDIRYLVKHRNTIVIDTSSLGLTLADADWTRQLNLVSVSAARPVNDSYRLAFGKKSMVSYKAYQRELHYVNKQHAPLAVVFRVSNDAVAFRYLLTGKPAGIRQVVKENTGFSFPEGTSTWLQPMQVARSGWESVNPAYEEHYRPDVPVEKVGENKTGWVYPALFKVGDSWALLTESGLDSNYCATRLISEATPGHFTVGFSDPRETIPGKDYLPHGTLPFSSPWRVVTIGSLETIITSTAGTDLAKPAVLTNTSFVKPGKASWSWISSKDDFITYDEQVRYIDLAADMHWQYCLIDVDWDRKIGYAGIKKLADYAKGKNVALWLWYNSAGDWNTVKYTPKNLLLTHESRMKEFARISEMGIKGVKIDFFAGDGQSVIKYYIDILNDAAANGLMVNFHGATLPRGWARTYPNLLTAEAVRGFENVTFGQNDADREAEICTMLPFTRNAFDPMDYTPVNLYKVHSNTQRKTTNAFQLALSVLFLSGVQHYAESPEGMSKTDEAVKSVLRALPDAWDEVKFLGGYPGRYVVVARRAGTRWYVAGINSQPQAQKVLIDPTVLGKTKGRLITEGKDAFSFNIEEVSQAKSVEIKASGGLLMVLE